jgi:hypothetical protein
VVVFTNCHPISSFGGLTLIHARIGNDPLPDYGEASYQGPCTGKSPSSPAVTAASAALVALAFAREGLMSSSPT